METRLSLASGQYGTKKLFARYGERLICVRYRYDAQRSVRHKAVKLIVETTSWKLRKRNAWCEPHDLMAARIDYSEAIPRERTEAAGSVWLYWHKLWELDWKTVRDPGLQASAIIEDAR